MQNATPKTNWISVCGSETQALILPRQTLAIQAKISVSHGSEAAEGGQTWRTRLTMDHGNTLYAFGTAFKPWPCLKPMGTWHNHRVWKFSKTEVRYPAVVRWKLAIKMRLRKGKKFTFFAHLELVDCSLATNYDYHITLKVFIHLLAHH